MGLECEQCGGTDFYKEAGFYYCSACQIQSQEVQEYVFEEFDGERPKATGPTKKLQSEKSDKTENKITSWECYNYILLGLTEELINLGADKQLKPVVKLLWMMYLEKLQVFKRGAEDVLPKLQAVNSAIDAEIVYGRMAKKRKKLNKSSSDETNPTSLDSSSLRRERRRKKRALVQAQYEDYSQKSQGTSSLHNETLTSLQTGSEKSSKHSTPITYNIRATKELTRKQSRYHLKKHRLDFNHSLPCHKIGYRSVSRKYRTGPYILSLNKLYAILYIALLIIKDKMQLCDMLRFIKEGHLSYNCYSHLLPEDYHDKILNFRNFKKARALANTPLREITSQMAALLGVEWYVTCPDLVNLAETYCKELNLPNEICDCVINIISKTHIRMSFRKQNKVPNYEGRVLSIILFVIKLLFGLDDVTEFQLSKFAAILNESAEVVPKMFDVVKWLKHIEYRKLVLENNHFPTSFDYDSSHRNLDLTLSFLAKKEYPETKFNTTKDNYKQLLSKLKDNLMEPEMVDFPPTLTPFRDYTKLLSKEKYLDLLDTDFCKHSILHMLRPYKFLNIVNKGEDPEIINGGASERWKMEKVINSEQDRKKAFKEKRELVTVKLTLEPKTNTNQEASSEESEVDSDLVKETFQVVNQSSFKKNWKKLRKRYSYIDSLNLEQVSEDLDGLDEHYPKHYNPYERFWVRCRMRLEAMSKRYIKNYFEEFPHNFRLIFKECQRIAQQTEQDFLVEYQLTELYLSYVAEFKGARKENVPDRLLARFLKNCVDFW